MAGPSISPKKRSNKGNAPTLEQTGVGIETTTKAGRDTSGGAQLNLRIDPEVKREFNTFAAANDLKLNALFEKMFKFYRDNH